MYCLNGSTAWAGFLFVLSALSAIALLIGYRTRLATAACWLLWLSLQYRNPAILNSGDVILRLILFWGLFLPWEAHWAVTPSASVEQKSWKLASTAYTVQVVCIYVFSVAWKVHPAWFIKGTAVYEALNIDRWTTNWGCSLLDAPSIVLQFLTHSTLIVELLPLLLLLPLVRPTTSSGRYQQIKLALVGILTFFHFCLSVVMHLGIFPWVCCVLWLPFLPEIVWKPSQPDLVVVKERKSRSLGLQIWSALPVAAIVYILYLNVYSTPAYDNVRIWSKAPAVALGLNQRWNMFAPRPFLDDGWMYVELGTDAGQVLVDVNGRPLPQKGAPTYYRNQRERRLGFSLWAEEEYQAWLPDRSR